MSDGSNYGWKLPLEWNIDFYVCALGWGGLLGGSMERHERCCSVLLPQFSAVASVLVTSSLASNMAEGDIQAVVAHLGVIYDCTEIRRQPARLVFTHSHIPVTVAPHEIFTDKEKHRSVQSHIMRRVQNSAHPGVISPSQMGDVI